jgi:hydrogenase maturation protease
MRVEHDDVPAIFRTRISPHQLGLSDLLAAALLTGEMPDRLVLFGVEPASVEPGLDLSEPVEASLDTLLAAVLEELRGLGAMPEPRPFDPAGRASFL